MRDERAPYIRFFTSDWKAGCAGMPISMEWTYLQVCLFGFDRGEPVAEKFLPMILGRNPNWKDDLDMLVELGKVTRLRNGAVFNERAIVEFKRAQRLLETAKKAGAKSAKKRRETSDLFNDPSNDLGTNQNQNQNQTFPKGKESPPNPHDFQPILDHWNAIAKTLGLPQITKLSQKRLTALKSRIRDHDQPTIIAAIDRIGSSRFLLGENDRGWRANFDWLTRPDTIQKLTEGTYDESHRQRSEGDRRSGLARALDDIIFGDEDSDIPN